MGGIDWIKTPVVKKACKHVFHQYTIRVHDGRRDSTLNSLKEKGIGAGVYYTIPIHKQKLYRDLGYNITLPKTEECSDSVLSLPIHPEVSKKDLDFISETLRVIQ
jgi:dTDP-4-amino-4,6-dideoxygalactose transaminase